MVSCSSQSIDGGKTWRPPWVIHQFGNEAKDIGYPSTTAVDKEGTLLTAFYTDYESTLKKKPNLYRVLSMRWSLKDWLHPTILGSISDGKQLKLYRLMTFFCKVRYNRDGRKHHYHLRNACVDS